MFLPRLAFCCTVCLLAAREIPAAGVPAGPEAPGLPDGLYAVVQTRVGAITAELFFELAPLTVANFVGLAEGTIPFAHRPPGQPFYDGLTFHRVVPGFVVQGGDPLGTGEGGPGYRFQDEFTPRLKHEAAGMLAMANAGPNDNGSQFFFTLAPVNRLNYMHTVFGRVVRGGELLSQLREGDVIERLTIVRQGERALAFRPDGAFFAHLRDTTPVVPPPDPARSPRFENPGGMPLPGWYPPWISRKLANYAATTGISIHVQILRQLDAPAPPAPPDDSLRILHERLSGNDPLAATLVFVAVERRWRLWLGEGWWTRLGASAGSAPGPGEAVVRSRLKQAILAEAQRRWDAGDSPNNIVDAATTGLIEALDRPGSLAPAAPANPR